MEVDRAKSPLMFREKEYEAVVRFMGPPNSETFPCLFIFGCTSTGKTLLISEIMKEKTAPYVWINCHECNTSSLMFSTIRRHIDDSVNDQKRVSNICEFVTFVKNKLKSRTETTYFIFDCAEVLRKDDPYILASLTRLKMLTGTNLCVVLISELPYAQFRSQIDQFRPFIIHFPDYTKEQMGTILSRNCPSDYDQTFYEGYVNIIMKTFYPITKNLVELQHLARVNFETYCEPLNEDPDYDISSLRLWRNIEPTLREALGSVYLRGISSIKWKASTATNGESSSETRVPTNQHNATRELPFYSKFLLLAAYFASYNLPKSDFKHFVKNQGKQPKKRISKKTAQNRHLLGPKPFSLDRMLSIFFSIVGERVLPSAVIFSQISSLVSMRLMSRASMDEQLDCPKFKCLAELELVAKIGKTVNLDVMGYLDDFL